MSYVISILFFIIIKYHNIVSLLPYTNVSLSCFHIATTSAIATKTTKFNHYACFLKFEDIYIPQSFN